jgi:signal peptidase
MKKIASTISTTILIILIAAAMFVAVPKMFGMKMYTILSGSMEPALSAGDLIYVAPTDPEKIEKGDVISFVLNDNLVVATHRVVDVDREGQRFTTQGDANDQKDASPVLYGNVIGVQKFAIPKIGFLFGYINTTTGRIIAVTSILALTGVSLLLSDKKNKPVPEEKQ